MIRPMLEQRKRIEIRWRDLDGFGHVNNAVFLTYLEECRDEFLQRHLHDPPERGEYMLVRIAIDYRGRSRWPTTSSRPRSASRAWAARA